MWKKSKFDKEWDIMIENYLNCSMLNTAWIAINVWKGPNWVGASSGGCKPGINKSMMMFSTATVGTYFNSIFRSYFLNCLHAGFFVTCSAGGIADSSKWILSLICLNLSLIGNTRAGTIFVTMLYLIRNMGAVFWREGECGGVWCAESLHYIHL